MYTNYTNAIQIISIIFVLLVSISILELYSFVYEDTN